MYLDNQDFLNWMEALSKKLNEIGKDLKSLVNTTDILEDNEKILDNQDLCFLFFSRYQKGRSNAIGTKGFYLILKSKRGYIIKPAIYGSL